MTFSKKKKTSRAGGRKSLQRNFTGRVEKSAQEGRGETSH